MAFKVNPDDLDMVRHRIIDLGLECLPPRTRIEGEGKSLYFYDDDNHLFELHTGSLRERLTAYASEGDYSTRPPLDETKNHNDDRK